MNTNAYKTQKKKSQSMADSDYNSGKSTFQFINNRPESFIQEKHQARANDSIQMKNITQLQSIVNENNSPKPFTNNRTNDISSSEVIQAYNLHQVDYATSIFSLPARLARIANNDISGRNYATFQVGGGLITRASNIFHSEKECWLAAAGASANLQQIQVASWPAGHFGGAMDADAVLAATGTAVDPVYTEREPCGACAPFLDEILPDAADVYYSFVYPSDETSKYKHDDEKSGVYGLLMLGGRSEKQVRKDGRKEGNQNLRNEMRELSA